MPGVHVASTSAEASPFRKLLSVPIYKESANHRRIGTKTQALREEGTCFQRSKRSITDKIHPKYTANPTCPPPVLPACIPTLIRSGQQSLAPSMQATPAATTRTLEQESAVAPVPGAVKVGEPAALNRPCSKQHRGWSALELALSVKLPWVASHAFAV